MIRGFHNLVESVQVRLGRAPSCAWVDERLPAYYDWDLPEHEFRAVERHLAHCPACKGEYEEVVTLVDSIREELAPAQFGAAATAEFAAGVMARIDAYEQALAARPIQPDPVWIRPRLVRFAAGCAVLLVLLAGAFLMVRTYEDQGVTGRTGPVAACSGSASAQASRSGACSAEFFASPVDLGLREDLEAEASRALAILEAEAILPHTEQELEAWARKEYPDVMWLYDLLRKEFGYAGSWKEMLKKSGTLLRFDWPTATDQPDCRPSLAAVEDAASVAGYEVALAADGQFVLPNLAWADVCEKNCRVSVRRLPEGKAPLAAQSLSPQPADYADRLAADRDLAEPVLAYLAVSSHLLGSAESDRLAADCKVLLGTSRLARSRAAVDCVSTCASGDEFGGILSLRTQLMESRR